MAKYCKRIAKVVCFFINIFSPLSFLFPKIPLHSLSDSNTKNLRLWDILKKINDDIKAAMKAKEKEKLNALRAIKSAFLLAKTESGAKKELSDEEAIRIMQKLVKQRKDSAEIYKEQSRNELYDNEMNEAKYIEAYLPKQMSDEELTEKIKAIIEETGASSMKDMGKVMGKAMKELAGKADGKRISGKVKEILS